MSPRSKTRLSRVAVPVAVCCIFGCLVYWHNYWFEEDDWQEGGQVEEADPLLSPYGRQEELRQSCPVHNVSQCLTYLQTQSPQWRIKPLLIHTAWQGSLGPVHTFLFYSFLATQDLSRSILVFWADSIAYQQIQNSSLFTPFQNHPNIKFKHIDIQALSKGSLLDPNISGSSRAHVESLLQADGALFGDLIRIVLLFRFGGIYVDTDVIFLRSFSVLLSNEFAYSWSGYSSFNSAVFCLKQNGSTVRGLMDYVVSEKKKSFHPFVLEEAVQTKNLSLFVYPAAFFDPAWLITDGFSPVGDLPFSHFSELFKPTNRWTGNFWSGAYAYHFHNQYGTQNWPEDSWIGHLEKEWKGQIARLPSTSVLQSSFSKSMNRILGLLSEYE